MDLSERKDYLAQAFTARFGRPPSLWSRAPGRVDLMGSHTDYNLGFVMTMTIDRDTWIALHPRADRQVTIYSLNVAGGATFSLDQIEPDEQVGWTNYVRGMAQALQAVGYPLAGFDGLIHSTIPFGSGLSSSAALEMAAGVALQMAGGFEIDPVKLAVLGQRAENQFVGVNCGILDQYSSALGRQGCALLLDCRHLTHRDVPLAPGLQVVICDTRAQRNLLGSEYGERRAQCEEGARLLHARCPEVLALRDVSCAQLEAYREALPECVEKRCRFIVEENQRVLDLAVALPAGDQAALRQLMAASYAGARDLYEIGAPAMQAMFEAMTAAPGVIAARQAGAGFGGCMLALVEPALLDHFTQSVSQSYQAATGIAAAAYPVSPAAGAGPLSAFE